MKVSKWVDMGQEVEVEVDINDIRSAMQEAFDYVTNDRLGEELPRMADVVKCFTFIGRFLSAITPEQIALMNDKQREIIRKFLEAQPERFK